MKKVFLVVAGLCTVIAVSAQQPAREITRNNSWIKMGINTGIPVGNLSNTSRFALGGEVKGQLMSTPHWGLGLTSGYTHFFPEEGFENFGSVPIGLFARYYPARSGFFVGADAGYSFQTGSGQNSNGGIYVRPQLGYHNRHWNCFGFYNGVFRSTDRGGHLQHVGVGVTYNIMFD